MMEMAAEEDMEDGDDEGGSGLKLFRLINIEIRN